MKVYGIIIARGGSKGIKDKNIISFNKKPLICWTIEQLKKSKICNDIWVSSDSDKILNIAASCEVNIIKRPKNISSDISSSEDAWIHAVKSISKIKTFNDNDVLVTPQVTSPVRHSYDFKKALKIFKNENLDSLFSANEINDYFIWTKKTNLVSENYNYKKRQNRQNIKKKYHENGSFYIFKKNILLKYKNRLGGKIGVYTMPEYKSLQIDKLEDIKFCSIVFNNLIRL